MWVITGLGNPGSKYSSTRHNVGFRVIDRLSEELGISLGEKDTYIFGKEVVEGHEIALLKPLTFMNRSGLAVKKVFRKLNVFPDKSPLNLIVIHDDLDMDAGIVKIRKNGSSGGHRGIESIIDELGTKDFMRIKIGIGRDQNIPAEKYVLCSFKLSERNLISEAILNGAGAARCIVAEGVERAMNRYNRSLRQDSSK